MAGGHDPVAQRQMLQLIGLQQRIVGHGDASADWRGGRFIGEMGRGVKRGEGHRHSSPSRMWGEELKGVPGGALRVGFGHVSFSGACPRQLALAGFCSRPLNVQGLRRSVLAAGRGAAGRAEQGVQRLDQGFHLRTGERVIDVAALAARGRPARRGAAWRAAGTPPPAACPSTPRSRRPRLRAPRAGRG